MLRKMGVTGSLMLLSLALTAFTPLQEDDGGITNYWWTIIIIVAFVLILFLILSVLFAYRDAPTEDELRTQAEQEEAEKAARRAAREQEAAALAAAAAPPPAPPEPAAPATEAAVPEPAPAKPDDLKKIEGVGPKVAELLNKAGIMTFAALADADVAMLQGVLDEAGANFRMIDPGTWGDQARLAAAGDWDALAKLQDELKGGRAAN
ncbi:MAG: hypothetical protein KDE04_03730 [Anaerolineales bacterium]|nr:hypothetical protein [Anaerolineales bacterium]